MSLLPTILALLLCGALLLDRVRLRAACRAAAADQAATVAALTEAERLARQAEQVAGVGYWRLDARTQAITWSEQIYRIHGLDPAACAPSLASAIDAYEGEARPRVQEIVRRAMQEGQDFSYESVIRRPDGDLRSVLARGAVERDSTGEVVRLFGTLLDITDIKRAEAAAHEAAVRCRLLTENAGDMIARCSLGGRIKFVTPACRIVLGYTPEELLGTRTVDYVHPDDLPMMLRMYPAQAAAGPDAPPISVQFRARRRDGAWIWLEGQPRVMFDDDGRPVEVHDVVRDITARKAVEVELVAALKKAESAAEAKAAFVANMSHELRTPLNSILGFAGVLMRGDTLSPADKRYVGLIEDAGCTLLTVVDDVLDLSRIEAEGLTLEPTSVDLTALVSDTVDLVRDQADVAALALSLRIPAGPVWVEADGLRLRQMLLNLLSNALKFTPEGAIEVTLEAECAGHETAVSLAVRDSGIGIAPGHVARLFERFEQEDSSIARRFGGTGLGLAICKGLAEKMGGSIAVQSEPGRGARFKILVRLPARPPASVVPRPAAEPPPRPAPCPRRLLVAEDVAVNQELIGILLEPIGVEIDAVLDGRAALEAASARVYDLILMDMQMPGMDGLEATRLIRALPGPAGRSPILALTANVLPEHVDLCRQAGMDGHVGKPFKPAELIEAVRRWTDPAEADGEGCPLAQAA